MKILASALLCLCSLIVFAQQDSPSGENSSIKKNGFLSSLVVDEGGLPLIVEIDITDNATNKIVQQFQSSRIGYSRVSLPSGNYNIVFSKQGYLFHSENFIILDSAGYEKKLKKVVLKKVEVGNNTVLKNIAFEENQSVLKEASFNDLQRVLELMNEIVTIQIEISGEIGSDAQAKTNKELAEQRAKVLIDYLVSKGVDRKRLKYSNNTELPIELVDNEESETVDSKVQVKIVDMGSQQIVQTGGQYYAVPETPTKKTKNNKKNKASEENNETVSESTEPVVTDNTSEAGALKDTSKEEPGIAARKQEKYVDIVTIEKKEEQPVAEETKTEEPLLNEGNNKKTSETEPAKEYVTIADSEQKEKAPSASEQKKTENVTQEEKQADVSKEDAPVVLANQVAEQPADRVKSESAVNSINTAETTEPEALVTKAEDTRYAEGGKEDVDTAMVSEYENLTIEDSLAVHSTAFAASDNIPMTIKNLGAFINSSFPDYAPLISADGTKLLFTSKRPLNTTPPLPAPKGKNKGKVPENKSNIYSSEYEKKQEQWLMAIPMKQEINMENVNNTAIALSNDTKKMLFHRTLSNTNTIGDIMETLSQDVGWNTPMMLLSAVNSPAIESTASYSPDGRTVYFVSDRQGGAGMKDIWYCTQNENGIWGEAVNLGAPVNTDKEEECVFIHPNGNALFFSSKGHNSKGGYDIFMSEHNDSSNTWNQPRNLGSAINTPEDDLYFVMAADGKTAYYSAVRPNGLGKEDIYQVLMEQSILKKNVILLKGSVVDEAGQALRAKITVKNKASDKFMGSFTSSAGTGKYLISLPEGENYEIKAIAPEHITYVRTIDLRDKNRYDVLKKDIVLETKNAFITSKVYDETGRPLNKVQIEVIDKATKQVIERTESDSLGYSRIVLPSNRSIGLTYKKPGYLFQSVSVTLPKLEPVKEYEKDLGTITFQKMEKGKKTVLSSISFDSNEAILKEEQSLPDLERVVTMLNNMPSLQVEVSDHIDKADVSKKMKKLSKERAKAIADRLISMGADKKRIRYKSYGASQPIAFDGMQQGRAMNRRAELKILKIDSEAEWQAEEKRWKEEQPVVEESAGNNPVSNESIVEKKDSTASTVVETKKEEPETGVMPGLDGVVSEEPVQNKKEEPETGVMPGLDGVVSEEPVQNKKEEPEAGVMPGLDGIVSEEPASTKEKKKEPVAKISLPERFVKFDSDKDGIISSNEIFGAIDAFFDDNSTIVADDINAMIDYFFDN